MPELRRHPESQANAIHRVRAEATREGHALRLRFVLEGEVSRVLVPPPRAPRPGEALWRHTCCEAFFAAKGASGYRELNFSPSGEWAAYEFHAYRDGAPCSVPDPRIVVRFTSSLELDAAVVVPPEPLILGLSAVVEETDGKLAYWALRHAAGKPDFHHPEAFALEIP